MVSPCQSWGEAPEERSSAAQVETRDLEQQGTDTHLKDGETEFQSLGAACSVSSEAALLTV